jgi:hypothetical protein
VSWLTDGISKRRDAIVHSLFSGVLSCFLLSRCEEASLYVLLVLPVYFSLKLPPLFKTDLLSSLSLSSVCFLFLSSCFSFFSPSCAGVESSIYRANGSGGVPIAVLLLRMGSRAFLPCQDAGLVGQWAWLAGRVSPGFSS